jgi:hypothetical protein
VRRPQEIVCTQGNSNLRLDEDNHQIPRPLPLEPTPWDKH